MLDPALRRQSAARVLWPPLPLFWAGRLLRRAVDPAATSWRSAWLSGFRSSSPSSPIRGASPSPSVRPFDEHRPELGGDRPASAGRLHRWRDRRAGLALLSEAWRRGGP